MSSLCRPNRRLVLLAGVSLFGPQRPAVAEPVFPPNSSIGLSPPPGYVISTDHVGFERDDGSATIVLRTAPFRQDAAMRPDILARLVQMTDRTLAASGLRIVHRRPLETSAFSGSLATGRTGTGNDLETV